MSVLVLFFPLLTFSTGSPQVGCHGQQSCAAAGSASMLQAQIRDHHEARLHGQTLAAANSSYSSALFVHTKDNQELFAKIAKCAKDLKGLIENFKNSDFVKKLCGDASTGSAWNCDPSKLSGADFDDLLQQFQDTTVGQEALEAWKEIVDVVKKPMAWIQDVINEWLPKLKQVVTDTMDRLKEEGMDGYFDLSEWDLNSFKQLFEQKDGKYGLTRFFEASAYVAAEIDASTVVTEILDLTAGLFQDVQTSLMALKGKPGDFMREKGILDAIQKVKRDIDAFFTKVRRDLLDFTEAKAFFDNPENQAVWTGKNIVQIGLLYASGNEVIRKASFEATKISVTYQALKLMTQVSNARLLQVSEFSVDKRIQMSVSAESAHADKALNDEATMLKSQMDDIDNEIKTKAPDQALEESNSDSLPFGLGDSSV